MLLFNYRWDREYIPPTPHAGGPKPCVWIAAPPYRGNEPHHIQVIAPNVAPYRDMFCGDVSGYRYLMIDVQYFGHHPQDWIDTRYRVGGYHFVRDIVADIAADVFCADRDISLAHGTFAVDLARQIRYALTIRFMPMSKKIGITVANYSRSVAVAIDMDNRIIVDILSFRHSSYRRSIMDYMDGISDDVSMIYDGNVTIDRALFARHLSAKLDKSDRLKNASRTLLTHFPTVRQLRYYQDMVHFNSDFSGLITNPALL